MVRFTHLGVKNSGQLKRYYKNIVLIEIQRGKKGSLNSNKGITTTRFDLYIHTHSTHTYTYKHTLDISGLKTGSYVILFNL